MAIFLGPKRQVGEDDDVDDDGGGGETADEDEQCCWYSVPQPCAPSDPTVAGYV